MPLDKRTQSLEIIGGNQILVECEKFVARGGRLDMFVVMVATV